MQTPNLKPWIDSQRTPLETALRDLVEINTHTANLDGVDQGMAYLDHLTEQLGMSTEIIHGRPRLIHTRKGQPRRRILLISHMDTVFPADSGFLHYEPMENGFVRGPGTGDIKGGLVLGLWAMASLATYADNYDVTMVVSSDEETGSPTLREWYMGGHTGADCAIGLEPGFPQGPLSATVPLGVVYQRRGYGALHVTVHGRDAHSGVPEIGLSAIEALAHRIVAIHGLSEPERGITTNVGKISGGSAANTIAGTAEALVSYRYLTQVDGEAIRKAVAEIISKSVVHNEGIDLWDSAKAEEIAFIPPMERTPENQKLVDVVLAEAQRLEQNVVPIARGGGSDANWVSASGTPSICGMGAPAEGIHTTEERIHLPMLFERIELLSATLHQLSEPA